MLSVTVAVAVALAVPGPNQPPELTVPMYDVFATCREELQLDITVQDTDSRKLELASDDLPKGAELTVWSTSDTGDGVVVYYRLNWTPTDEQVGTQRFSVVASDGMNEVTKKIEVKVADDWLAYFMPGAAYIVHAPRAEGELGQLHGPSVQFPLVTDVSRNERRGPSHTRLYVEIGLLRSTEAKSDALMRAAVGLDLSLERQPGRKVLLPIFGADVGLYMEPQRRSVWFVSPFGGVHLWADRNLFVTAGVGYVFPWRSLERLRGPFGRLAVSFSLW